MSVEAVWRLLRVTEGRAPASYGRGVFRAPGSSFAFFGTQNESSRDASARSAAGEQFGRAQAHNDGDMSPERPFIELTFYETYYFANIIKNVLEDRFAYLRNLDDFYGDARFLDLVPPFQKFSAFHQFIAFVIDNVVSEDVENIDLAALQARHQLPHFSQFVDLDPRLLPVNVALDRFGIPHTVFADWLSERGKAFSDATDHDVSEYYEDLRLEGPFDDLLECATHEVFFVLFQNRKALLLFNDLIAAQMRDATDDDIASSKNSSLFLRPGVLKRVAFPVWVQRAVFFRDRGLCVLCHRDLSGVLNIWSEENFDHIVPLASGGLNDVSNIQLLCRPCNSLKRAGDPETSNRYEAWYPED